METRQVTFGEMKIRIPNGFRLVAEVQEIPLLHQARSIKAVTYHDLAVKRTPDGLTATIVFDV
jgi:SHS2 domain-containing protein